MNNIKVLESRVSVVASRQGGIGDNLFECLDLADPPALDKGLLRAGAAELLFLHREAAAYGPEDWALAHRLTVAGGLALVPGSRTGTMPRRFD